MKKLLSPLLSRTNLRAFTLIELLTVIAIIGILAAILIPVVSQAREQARVAQCVSNLRDIGSAVHLYAGEFGDRVPPHIRSDGAQPDSEWGSLVAPNHGVIGLLLPPERGGPNMPSWSGGYLDSAESLFCPATRDELFQDAQYRRPETIDRANPITRAGYMWIYRVWGVNGAGPRDNTRVTNENPNNPYVFDFPAPGTSGLGPRFTVNPHQSRVNVLHLGGHVTSFTTEELLQLPRDAGGNTLFDYLTTRQRR